MANRPKHTRTEAVTHTLPPLLSPLREQEEPLAASTPRPPPLPPPPFSAPPGARIVGCGSANDPIRIAVDAPIVRRLEDAPLVNITSLSSSHDPHLFPSQDFRYLGIPSSNSLERAQLREMANPPTTPPAASPGTRLIGSGTELDPFRPAADIPIPQLRDSFGPPVNFASPQAGSSAVSLVATNDPVTEPFPDFFLPDMEEALLSPPLPFEYDVGQPVQQASQSIGQDEQILAPAAPLPPSRFSFIIHDDLADAFPPPPLLPSTSKGPYDANNPAHAAWFTNPRPVPLPARKPEDEAKIEGTRGLMKTLTKTFKKSNSMKKQEQKPKTKQKPQPRDERAKSEAFAAAIKRRSQLSKDSQYPKKDEHDDETGDI